MLHFHHTLVTPCSQVEVHWRFGGTYLYWSLKLSQSSNHTEAKETFLAPWHIRRPWIWRQHVLPKRRSVRIKLHGITRQKIGKSALYSFRRENLKFNANINLFRWATCVGNRFSEGLSWNSVPFAGCIPAHLCFSSPLVLTSFSLTCCTAEPLGRLAYCPTQMFLRVAETLWSQFLPC
jgi:hypothetical protein